MATPPTSRLFGTMGHVHQLNVSRGEPKVMIEQPFSRENILWWPIVIKSEKETVKVEGAFQRDEMKFASSEIQSFNDDEFGFLAISRRGSLQSIICAPFIEGQRGIPQSFLEFSNLVTSLLSNLQKNFHYDDLIEESSMPTHIRFALHLSSKHKEVSSGCLPKANSSGYYLRALATSHAFYILCDKSYQGEKDSQIESFISSFAVSPAH